MDEGYLADLIADESAYAGASEIMEFTDTLRSEWIAKFSYYREQLNNVYEKNTQYQTVDDKRQYLKDLAAKYTFASDRSKKGGAYILPYKEWKGEIRSLQAEIKKVAELELNKTRRELYSLKENHQLEQISLGIMKDIYICKKQITGITEHFAFSYESSLNSSAAVAVVSMDNFFKEFQDLISLGDTGTFGYGDFRTLKFTNTKSVAERLDSLAKSHKVENIYNIDYDAYKNVVSNAKYGLIIYRSDKKGYDVVNRQIESGFVAEAFIRMALEGTTHTMYEKDNIDWYAGEDILSSNNIGYSVKNLLGTSPTLLRINSLHTVVNNVLNRLQNISITNKNLKEVLKNEIFQQAKQVSAGFGITIQKLQNIISV